MGHDFIGGLACWLGDLAWWSNEFFRSFLRPALSRKNIATFIQIAGGVITVYGLGSAYIRARYGQNVRAWIGSLVKALLKKLRGQPGEGVFTIHVPTMRVTAEGGIPQHPPRNKAGPHVGSARANQSAV